MRSFGIGTIGGKTSNYKQDGADFALFEAVLWYAR